MKKSLLLLPFLFLSALYADGTSYVKVHNVKKWDALNIREHANHKSKKVSSIPANEQCVINHGCGKDISLEAMGNMQEEEIKLFLAQSNENWCYVTYKGQSGWVNKKYLKESKATCK